MNINSLNFKIMNQKIRLKKFYAYESKIDSSGELCQIHVSGDDSLPHNGAKQGISRLGKELEFVNEYQNGNDYVVVQKNSFIQLETHFKSFDDTNAVQVYNNIKNISASAIRLEHISSLYLCGIGQNGTKSTNDLFLHRFINSWHEECQPQRTSFVDLGMVQDGSYSMKRICGSNTGTWSTKEELAQAIIEDVSAKSFLMFQIENNSSWYWEIGVNYGEYYLDAGGPNQSFNQWNKILKPGDEFKSVTVGMCYGSTLNDVVGEMTKYRRRLRSASIVDENLPSIFNEYMHLSWDNPSEVATRKIAPVVAGLGIEYYVIDCGWHDEEDNVYPYVGKWLESKKRFPSGIKATIDYLHSLGLKAGLWIEPEIVGKLCKSMLEYYDDDCFFVMNQTRTMSTGRYQLDIRNPKVEKYLSKVIERMVKEYGVDYIKMDYNQCFGAGTEINSDSLGDGLLKYSQAFLEWVKKQIFLYPNVLFESCASGGQRMEYATLSVFHIQSTSDQTLTSRYPYIVGNIFSAVIPEQAAVWSYPVSGIDTSLIKAEDIKGINNLITNESVIMNVINSLLGRTHFASHLELLSEEKLKLIKEGVDYYNSITEDKKTALPYFPNGFHSFYQDTVCCGLKTNKKLYLCVWNMGCKRIVKIDLSELKPKSVMIGYPQSSIIPFSLNCGVLEIVFSESLQARLFEIQLY